MRRFALVLAALPLPPWPNTAPPTRRNPGQYPGQAPVQQPAPLYPYNKNQLPPGAVYDNNPGIPTSGLEQAGNSTPTSPATRRAAPPSTTAVTIEKAAPPSSAANGTTVCRDEYGRKERYRGATEQRRRPARGGDGKTRPACAVGAAEPCLRDQQIGPGAGGELEELLIVGIATAGSLGGGSAVSGRDRNQPAVIRQQGGLGGGSGPNSGR